MSIAEEMVARAQATREAHAARLATPAPTARRLAEPGPVTTREEAVRRMADVMREGAAAHGGVDEEYLLARGYSRKAVASLGPDARDLANASAVRRS